MILTYIATKMDPDQMALKGAVCSGFIVFDSMIKFGLYKPAFFGDVVECLISYPVEGF